MSYIEKRSGDLTNTLLTTAAIGGSAAAAHRLLKDVIGSYKEHKNQKHRDSSQINDNTIVLSVPRKSKSTSSAKKRVTERAKTTKTDDPPRQEPVTPVSDDIPDSLLERIGVKSSSARDGFLSDRVNADTQKRDVHGRFHGLISKETKNASVSDDYLKYMVGGAGILGGYALTQKLLNKLRAKEIKRDIELARRQYMSILDGESAPGAEKLAEALLCDPRQEKKALIGETLAAFSIPVIASAYLTKRILDKKFIDDTDDDTEEPKINRVIIKSSEHDSGIETTPDVALALIAMAKDDMSRGSVLNKCASGAMQATGSQGRGSSDVLDQFAGHLVSNAKTLDQKQKLFDMAQNGISPSFAMDQMISNPIMMAGVAKLYKNDKDATTSAISRSVLNKIRGGSIEDRRDYMKLLASPKNQAFVNGMVRKQIGNWTSKFRVGGGFLNRILTWLHKTFGNTRLGRSIVNRSIGRQLGV